MRYKCNVCNVYEYDEELGDDKTGMKAGVEPKDFPDSWRCPICQADKTHIIPQDEEAKPETSAKKTKKKPAKKDIIYYRDIAREKLMGVCAVNKVCDGHPDKLCMGQKYGKAIGFGGAGQGLGFYNNFKELEKIKLKMRVVKKYAKTNIETEFLGNKIKMPVLVPSISGVEISMNNSISEPDFQKAMIEGAKLYGTIGMSGNTVDYPEHPGIDIIKENKGWGIPMIKPQEQKKLLEMVKRAEKANPIAIGVDLDGAGSTNWALRGKPVYRKSESELKELVDSTDKPFMFKGVLTVEDAQKAVDSGAKVLGVSNHGGRIVDNTQGVAEVLPEIAKEAGKKIIITADGAVRTGYDVLKMLALGANAAMIGRPLARMALAGGAEAIKAYLDYVQKDFTRAMRMTGCDSIKEVTSRILVKGD